MLVSYETVAFLFFSNAATYLECANRQHLNILLINGISEMGFEKSEA